MHWRLAILGCIVFGLGGCAVGFDQMGQPVLGFSVGVPDASTAAGAGKFTTTALSFLGIPAPVAAGIGGLVTVGLGAFGVKQQSKASDQRAAAARLQGQNEGWDLREQAASIQHPLPPPPATTKETA